MFIRSLLLLLLVFSTNVHADVRRTVESIATVDSLGVGSTTITVPSTTTTYTKSFSLLNQPIGPVGVMYKATSGGVVNLRIEALQSFQSASDQTVAGNDTTYVSWEPIETALTDQAWHTATLDTLIMPYGRFRIIGVGSNATSTTIQIKVGKQ